MRLGLLLALPEHKLIKFKSLLSKTKNYQNINCFDFPISRLSINTETLAAFDWKRVDDFELLIFTSSFSVDVFFQALDANKIKLSSQKIAAVGRSVSENLRLRGVDEVILPSVYRVSALIEPIERFIKPKSILLLGASFSESAKHFAGQVGEFSEIEHLELYRTLYNEALDVKVYERFIDYPHTKLICLSSPMNVRIFHSLVAELPEMYTILCIGETTLKEAQRLFPSENILIPREFSYRGMLDIIDGFF